MLRVLRFAEFADKGLHFIWPIKEPLNLRTYEPFSKKTHFIVSILLAAQPPERARDRLERFLKVLRVLRFSERASSHKLSF